MEAKLSLTKKIGSFVSNILLGDTKEIIIRMDERLFSVSKRVENIENEIRNEIRPSLNRLVERLSMFDRRLVVVEDRLQIAWKDEVAQTNSPRQLNEKGTKILLNSGIKEIVDAKKDALLEIVRSKNAKNPYDAEEYVLQAVDDLRKDAALVESLKTGAYSVGADIGTVLLVGGIYLRDQIFPKLGFAVDQANLDKSNV